MDNKTRNALHSMYKDRVKDMVTKFAWDLLEKQIKSKCPTIFSIQQIYEFADDWVEKHIKKEYDPTLYKLNSCQAAEKKDKQ